MPACARPGIYVPRQTHDCDAAVLVRRHLPGFLARLEESGQGPLPEFVKAELEGFAIDPAERRAMWRETTEQVANMLAMDPYPGFQGKYFAMPARNVVPKPVQKPHPPLWVACSNIATIASAGQWGMGALGFQFVSPEAARAWVNRYYTSLTREPNRLADYPANPNIAMVSAFMCAPLPLRYLPLPLWLRYPPAPPAKTYTMLVSP